MALEKWEIDNAHSGVNFTVRHMVITKVRGHFARWSGTIESHDGKPDNSSVEVTIDASSIETGVADRDAHLKSADFLDVARYPAITFRSRRSEKVDGEHLRVIGDLTIRDVTREVALDVEYAGRGKDPWGNERAGFSARTSINRSDFGVTWNQLLETGGMLVSDRIDVELEIEAVLKAKSVAA